MKWPLFDLSFRTKIYAGILSIVLLTGILIALSVSRIVSESLSADYRRRGAAVAVSLAQRGEDAILAMDFLRMKRLIDEMVASGDDIHYAFFQNERGEVLSHSFSRGFPTALKTINGVSREERYRVRLLSTGEDTIYDFAAPVQAGSFRVGTVRIGMLRNKITSTINELLWAIFAFILISVFIADLVGFTLARSLTGRVRSLQKATEEILTGNLNVRVGRRVNPGCEQASECRREHCPAEVQGLPGCWAVIPEAEACCADGEACQEPCPSCPLQPGRSGDEIQQLADSFDAVTFALRANIAQLARSKSTLEKSEAKYRGIFEGSMDLIFVADGGGRLIDINPAGIRLLESEDEPGQLTGMPLEALFKDAEEVRGLMAAIDRTGFAKDRECRLTTRTGRELDVLVSVSCRRDDDGRVIEYEGVVKDITRRKLMRNQMLQAEKLAALGQLSAGVAHEINNPLGLILGYTQLLIRDESQPSERLEDLKTIERQTRNCKKIVEALLSFARRTETHRSAVAVNDTVDSVVRVIRHQLELDGIDLAVDLADGMPTLFGDGEKLRQVWMNLLMNARQAVGSGGQISVTTGFDLPRRQAYISVEDTGPGIPSDLLNRIFDPFFTTKPTGQGTGLGLSVSYGIVQDHQGSIDVKSEEGMGAVFTVYLPVPDAHDPEMEGHDATQAAHR